MTAALDTLLAFITHHSRLAYGAIFLISFSESLALVGLLVPGTIIMFGVGAVVATGSLGLTPVLVLAAAGAVAGDGISYWLGHHYRDRLARTWPFSRYPAMLKNAEDFFHRHGGKSILFGRFVGPIRPVIPVVAGMLGMGSLQFGVVNLISAVGWALVYILPGVFFGTSLAVAGAVSTRLVALIVLFFATAWSVVWLGRKLVLLFVHRGPIWSSALKDWAAADTPGRGIARPARRLLSYLIQRQHGEEMLFGALILLLIAAGWGFLGVLQDVLAKDPLVLADQAVYNFFQSMRSPWADQVLVAVTELGDSFVNVCLFVSILLTLLVKRRYRTAGFWAMTVLGGIVGVQLLKLMIRLPRPVALYQGASAYGFPSGHTTMSVILYGFLTVMLVRGLTSAWRWWLLAAALLASSIIAISRLYLGAHWLSDVLGGLFIGTSWVALLGIAYLKRPAEGLPRRLLGLLTVLVVVIAGAWHVFQHHKEDLALYAPRHNTQSMPLNTWLSGGWRNLPAWRVDMAGEREQPLTIQWAGLPVELAQYLTTKGWQPAPSLDLKNILGMLSMDTPIEKLPVLPRLHSGRIDRLCLVRKHKTRRWVLRLWPSDVEIAGDSTPLFVGTIEIERRRRLTGLIAAAGDTGEYDRPQAAFTQTLYGRFDLKSVRRPADEIQVEHEQRRLHWQGGVVLVYEAASAR